ncbi:UNKNOWN [Stylonychia lemnae]|uniref:Uncharacterized protein n=1 Tax=Stylonychia lemnae TaxID=5949 RepID=A0A077ZY43_STYLE|nr:UNKNOWN [Stylonychia lemnae]|eukprot:CDW74547.1 UNKNOWN [Stylonychia lemnae]
MEEQRNEIEEEYLENLKTIRLLVTAVGNEFPDQTIETLSSFVRKHPETEISIAEYPDSLNAMQKHISLSLVLAVTFEDSSIKEFGIKMVLSRQHPYKPPKIYLDEPIIPELFNFFDYLSAGNVISFDDLRIWDRYYSELNKQKLVDGEYQKLTLEYLLAKVYTLLSVAPPIYHDFMSA